jgi:hypothetical protein
VRAYHAQLIAANALFTLFECCDTALSFFVSGAVSDEINFEKGTDNFRVSFRRCLCLALNAFMVLDMVVQASTGYTLTTSGGLVVLLPVSAFMRPVFLAVRVRFVSDAAQALAYTITNSVVVLVLLLLTVIMAAIANVLLFRSALPASNLDGRTLENVRACRRVKRGLRW